MRFRSIAAITVVIFIAGTIISPGTVSAWEKGHMKVVPSVKFNEQYDTNIFYDRDDPKHDWISILTPGIFGQFGFGANGKHKLTADYKVDLGMFGKYHDQNYGNQDVFAGAFLDFDEITVDVNNRFQFTSSRAGTEFEHRNLRKIDTLNAVLGWHFNKIDFDTGYQFYIVNYLSDTLEQLNRYENAGWITGYVQVAPKTKALLEFNYRNLQYPDASGRNGNAYSVWGGVKGEITAKVTGIAKVGLKAKDYNSSSSNDYFGITTNIALLYAMNDRTDFTFSYNREPYESTYNNNNFYTGDHFLFNVLYRFGHGFVGKFDTMYFHNSYPSPGVTEDKKRRDNEWAIGPRLEYHWKEYAIAGIGYRFHQRESNISSRRYDQHVFNADIKLMF